jgi:hypothetical protein
MCRVEDVMSELAEDAADRARGRAKTEALIVRAYEQNQSLREIASVADLSHEQVRRILSRHGVPIRGRGRAAQPGPADSTEP